MLALALSKTQSVVQIEFRVICQAPSALASPGLWDATAAHGSSRLRRRLKIRGPCEGRWPQRVGPPIFVAVRREQDILAASVKQVHRRAARGRDVRDVGRNAPRVKELLSSRIVRDGVAVRVVIAIHRCLPSCVYGRDNEIPCAFVSNSGRNGAGVSIVNGSPLFTNCEFTGNSATNFFLAAPRGAGIYIPSGSAVLVNCLVAQNTCSGGENFGGGIYNDADLTLVNCTVTANTAENGDGIANFNQLTARNCIVWGNGTEDLLTGGGSIEVITYSAVNAAGAGNILTDPLFLSNFRLQSISPCIDAGSNARVSPDALDLDCDGNTTEPVPIDADGKARFFDDPITPNSGAGTPPLVDMGAYEFGASVPPSLRGDMNCDCVTNLNDLPLFVEAMLDPLGLIGCFPSRADMNGDGSGNGEDVQPFIQAVLP